MVNARWALQSHTTLPACPALAADQIISCAGVVHSQINTTHSNVLLFSRLTSPYTAQNPQQPQWLFDNTNCQAKHYIFVHSAHIDQLAQIYYCRLN